MRYTEHRSAQDNHRRMMIEIREKVCLNPLHALLLPSPSPLMCPCQLAGRMRRALLLHSLWSSLSRLLSWPLQRLAASWAWLRRGAQGGSNQRALGSRQSPRPAVLPLPGARLFLGHTRFATSSVPSVVETHPHAWSPERRMRVWGVEEGSGGGRRVRARVRNVRHYITHNGDFDFWNLFGR